jgi:dTDP-glucose pyrophosphorylase
VLIHDLSSCTVAAAASVKDVVESLTLSGLRLCLVVDEHSKLFGIVSDGDIRRGLLAGKGLDDPVVEIMNRGFASAPDALGLVDLVSQARAKEISHIPLVDAEGRVTGLFVDQIDGGISHLPNVVVIMAGGMGMRLRPLTETTPKPMLSVAGKPMVQHTIEALRSEGFRDIVISLNYLGEQIEQHFGDGADFGVNISYVTEKEPLGTAGALSLISQTFTDPVVVVNGDLLLLAKISDMLEYHQSHEAEITVGVKVLDTQIPFGVVEVDGSRVMGITEKPVYRDFVNAGVYVLEPRIVEGLTAGARIDMPELVETAIAREAVVAFPLHETWIDMGRPADLRRAEDEHRGRKGKRS